MSAPFPPGEIVVMPEQGEAYWREQFMFAMSGLSWAVGKLGDEAGYAGTVHAHLTHPPRFVKGTGHE